MGNYSLLQKVVKHQLHKQNIYNLKGELIMALKTNTYYYIKRNGCSKYLNIYGTSFTGITQPIKLWDKVADDPMQKWMFTKDPTSTNTCIRTACNTDMAINVYDATEDKRCTIYHAAESDSIYDYKNDCLVRVSEYTSGLYYIYLPAYGLYLTADGASNGTQVTWESKLSYASNTQLWEFEEIAERSEITVTSMPNNAGYTNNIEYFHPDSGMVNGTWAENNGALIEEEIRQFYTKVYGIAPTANNKYLYSLYGGKYVSGIYSGQFHPGVDINYYHGATIYPSRSGKIVDIGDFYITVQSGNEYLIYVHLSPYNFNLNTEVTAGVTPLGTQSCLGLGYSEEEVEAGKDSHLHIEVHKVSTNDKEPKLPTPTVNDTMDITVSPYFYLND